MIYLDYASTSPMYPEVVEAVTEAMASIYGNPSSVHAIGREARKYLDDARKTMAHSIHSSPSEIIYTSGGTEANNIALFGAVRAMKGKGKHIITSNIEHPAVLKTCQQLEADGFKVTYLKADAQGLITAQQVKDALTEDTILVSIMYGNNEVGTIQPIEEIGNILAEHQAVFHTDAVQAYGVLPIDVNRLQVDLLSVSAHKINGPKGIGFLYVKKNVQITPLLFGGDQERTRRAGTENLPAIMGFQKAVEMIEGSRDALNEQYQLFERIFIETMERLDIDYFINGQKVERLPHIMNVSFHGMEIESFLVNLDLAGIYASSGSACTAGTLEPSHVLLAMYGKESPQLKNSVRFSFGYNLTVDQVKLAAEKIAEIVRKFVK